MDSLRDFDEEMAYAAEAGAEPAMERPPEIGIDERRMHVRAYNHWVSLLADRPYPSIRDLDHRNIDDFGPHSVLLDFSRDSEDPAVAFVGGALSEECGLDGTIGRISEVPARSLLSRLTDHYLQIIANRAPIGFEAEFVNHRGHPTMYRGILMPFTSTGEDIDFIYGVINWKELADAEVKASIASAMSDAARAAADCPVWADGPHADFAEPLVAVSQEDAPGLFDPPALDADAGLGDWLGLARDAAAEARGADHRSRAALYRAIGHAWDFAVAARGAPEDYAELLKDAGLKPQARAPMTPVVKLVFGADYDKTRLTEFATALCWADRNKLAAGALAEALAGFDGGLKGVVAEERRARRPAPRPRPDTAARRAGLASRPAIVHVDVPGADGDIVLLLARREADGRLAIVAPVAEDEALIARALDRTA